jgi:hypothetical protein
MTEGMVQAALVGMATSGSKKRGLHHIWEHLILLVLRWLLVKGSLFC